MINHFIRKTSLSNVSSLLKLMNMIRITFIYIYIYSYEVTINGILIKFECAYYSEHNF